MLALRYEGDALSVADVAPPHDEAEAIVRVHLSGICNTDVGISADIHTPDQAERYGYAVAECHGDRHRDQSHHARLPISQFGLSTL